MNTYELFREYITNVALDIKPKAMEQQPNEYIDELIRDVGYELGVNVERFINSININSDTAPEIFAKACSVAEFYIIGDLLLDEFLIRENVTYDELVEDTITNLLWKSFLDKNLKFNFSTAKQNHAAAFKELTKAQVTKSKPKHNVNNAKSGNNKSKAEQKKSRAKNTKKKVSNVVPYTSRNVMPASIVMAKLGEVLISGSNADKLIQRYKRKQDGSVVTYEKRHNKAIWTFKKAEEGVYIETLIDMDKNGNVKSRNNKGLVKITDYVISQINRQAWDWERKELYQDYIDIDLNDLVNAGIYNNIDTARRGLHDCKKHLDALKVGYWNKRTDADGNRSLFIGTDRHKTMTRIYLSRHFNWYCIMRYFTYVPNWIYALNLKSYVMIKNICQLSAQRLEEIEKKGCFNLSLKNIAEGMNLPNLDDTKDHQKCIKEPIIECVEIINSLPENTDIKIEIIGDNNSSVRSWISKGYARITITGEMKAFLLGRKKNKKNNTNKAIARNKLKQKEPEALTEPIKPEEVQQNTFEINDMIQSII